MCPIDTCMFSFGNYILYGCMYCKRVKAIYFYKSRYEWAIKPGRNSGCEFSAPLTLACLLGRHYGPAMFTKADNNKT